MSKTILNFPITFEEQNCPHCGAGFALIAILHDDDPEYGQHITWGHQVHNKGFAFYCPYCGKNFEEKKSA